MKLLNLALFLISISGGISSTFATEDLKSLPSCLPANGESGSNFASFDPATALFTAWRGNTRLIEQLSLLDPNYKKVFRPSVYPFSVVGAMESNRLLIGSYDLSSFDLKDGKVQKIWPLEGDSIWHFDPSFVQIVGNNYALVPFGKYGSRDILNLSNNTIIRIPDAIATTKNEIQLSHDGSNLIAYNLWDVLSSFITFTRYSIPSFQKSLEFYVTLDSSGTENVRGSDYKNKSFVISSDIGESRKTLLLRWFELESGQKLSCSILRDEIPPGGVKILDEKNRKVAIYSDFPHSWMPRPFIVDMLTCKISAPEFEKMKFMKWGNVISDASSSFYVTVDGIWNLETGRVLFKSCH